MGKINLKRILALILTLTVVLSALPLTALPAAAETSGDYEYEVLSETDKTCRITKYKGSATELTIPSQLDGYTVTEISNYLKDSSYYGAFSSCKSLTSVTIPDSVTSIGDQAFYNCTSLTSVTIGNGVTNIGNYAFEDCTSLTSITIPDSVTSIGGSAFKGCNSLTSVTIGSGVTNIDYETFYGCTSLTAINVSENNKVYSSIDGVLFNKDKTKLILCPAGKSGAYTIPLGTKSIGYFAFLFCTSLVNIAIPDSVIGIDYGAFLDCTSLTSVTIGNGVTSIGFGAFGECTSLTSITIPDSVTSIGKHAFGYCTSLTSITIPDSVTSIDRSAFYDTAYYDNEANWENGVLYIGNHLIEAKSDTVSGRYQIKQGTKTIAGYAFSSCKSLTSVTIPDSVTSIGSSAFSGCTALTSITIPDSVTSIGSSAFSSCTALTAINVSENNTAYSSIDGVLLNKEKTEIICCPEAKSGSFAIPDSVTSIGSGAFRDCTSLTSVTIGNGVTSIGDYAFGYCGSLTSITIPSGVTSIGSGAFRDCTSLTSVTIPDSVTSIGYDAFENCTSLTSITIPDSVTSIGSSAFEGCTSLTSITIPDSVTGIGHNAFYNTAYYNNEANWKNGVLYIGNHLIKAKEDISGEYQIKQGTKTIAGYAFSSCKSLTSVTIPDSVTSIGYRAFDNTAYYNNEANWENGVLYIGNHLIKAKDDISGSYEIKEGTRTIANSAFSSCTSLTSITIPSSVTGIGSGAGAFEDCTSLTAINVSENNTAYSSTDGVLFNKDKTELICYPAGKTAEAYAIPDGVATISVGAFCYCTFLTSVTIPNSVTSIGAGAFLFCTNLNEVTISSGVTSIGSLAFLSCNFYEVTIPASVTEIGELAFGYSLNFFVSDFEKISGFTICGSEGTAAEQYAKDNGFNFTQHLHMVTLSQGFEATCEADGEKDYYICSDCGKYFEDEAGTKEITNINEWKVIPAKGHSFGNWVVTTEATCTEEGVETRTCTACGKTETRPVSAKGHSLTLHQGFAAACEAAGEKTYYYCSDCDKYFEDEAATKEITNIDEWKVIPAKGHSFSAWAETKAATCTEAGEKTRTCTNCGKTETQPIPAKGHNWVVSADGTKRTCTNCGAEEALVTLGDVNGDGKVSAVDARWALQCAAKKRTLDEKQTKAADMNKDGKITAVDARQILKKAAGKA